MQNPGHYAGDCSAGEIEAPQPAPTNAHSLGIIGAVEPVYVLPMKAPFAGRIDTGAETSSH